MSKKCTPLRREAHFEDKMVKTPWARTTVERSDVEKVHAVVVRRCAKHIRSQHVKNTRGSDHFWTFRCRLAWQAQRMVHLVKSEQNVRACGIFNYNRHYTTLHSNTLQLQLHLHYIPLHYTPLHYTTLHYIPLHYITLRYTPRHDTTTTLHYIPLHSTTLHYTTLNYATLHYITLPNIILQLQPQLQLQLPVVPHKAVAEVSKLKDRITPQINFFQ